MKFFTKYNIASIALIVLVLIGQFIPFTNTEKLQSSYEDPSKTWAELPVGMTGKDRSSWPAEIKYGDFDTWEPETQVKYPLYGKKNVSIFTYVWNPAGSLHTFQYIGYVFLHVFLVGLALFAFLVKNYMAKAVVAFMFALEQIFAFVETLILKSSGFLTPYAFTTYFLLVTALLTIAIGIFFIPEYKREKAANAELKKQL